ncbi:aspartate carbamoyltransferase [Candidatus Roizmanbacteria bacterium]|nr:aspartate carbamoyltransferase [Candidatus Roizmanbacteria bacterium]
MLNKKTPIQKINGQFKGKDIVSLDQFDRKSIKMLFKTTNRVLRLMKKNRHINILRGTVSTLLFYEPSSRTLASFSGAIKRLGGETISYQDPLETSSAIKGETYEDSMKVFESYSDLLIIRHFEFGMGERAATAALYKPVINAGDGTNEHPTQGLLDLYTIDKNIGSLDNLTGLIAGDLLYGRTLHSLLKGLSLFKNNTIYLLSPRSLRLPIDRIEFLRKRGMKLVEVNSVNDIPKNCAFWYWTRVQKERFKNLNEYAKVKNKFILTPSLVKKKGNKNMILMHPLPRVGEIDTAVDSDPRAIYLGDQIRNGLYTRMALVSLILGRI